MHENVSMHACILGHLSIPVSRELTSNNMYQNMIATCMHTITHTAKSLWQHAHICTGTRLQYAHNQSHTLVHDCSMHTYVPVHDCICTNTWLQHAYICTSTWSIAACMHIINRTHWYMTVACTHVICVPTFTWLHLNTRITNPKPHA